ELSRGRDCRSGRGRNRRDAGGGGDARRARANAVTRRKNSHIRRVRPGPGACRGGKSAPGMRLRRVAHRKSRCAQPARVGFGGQVTGIEETMSYITNLKCRECGQEYPISPLHVCETCFGPLEVTYDYARIRAAISRSIIEKRPHNLWRYRELLPVEGEPEIGPHSGFTPLVKVERLGAELGVKRLYIKVDTVNHP